MGSHTRVIEAIDAGMREIREEARARIEEIERRRTDELGQLERARSSLVADDGWARAEHPSEGAATTSRPKRRRRRKKHSSPSAAALAERRESVLREISESAEPLSSGALARALGYGLHAVHTALAQLLKEQRISRIGTSSKTRYVARAGSGRGISPGSLPSRIAVAVEDRVSPTAEELAQVLGEPVESVVAGCAALQAEEKLRMGRRDGRPVYVLPGA